MPRPVGLLFLVLALAGQPLRHAEAASDLARSLAHLAAGDTIEVPDGGVGDDSGVAVVKAETGHASASTRCPSWDDLRAPADGLSPLPILAFAPPRPGRSRGQRGHVAWLPRGASQRQAWLQLLRF
jgi:hypothetical protein